MFEHLKAWFGTSRRYQAVSEDDTSSAFPLPCEVYKQALKRAVEAHNHTIAVGVLGHIVDQINARYEHIYAGYQSAIKSRNGTAKNYYSAQLFLLQAWAQEPKDFMQSLGTVQAVIKEKRKFNFSLDQQASGAMQDQQNILNILGILYAFAHVSENFYGMSLLLKIILLSDKTSTHELLEWTQQCEIFFLNKESELSLNLGDTLHKKLLDAFKKLTINADDQVLQKNVKILSQEAYNELFSIVRYLSPSGLEDLFYGKTTSLSM